MNNISKASITKILFEQAIESLHFAYASNQKNEISKEVQHSINVVLLLGIANEGIINEIGERELDAYTWKELEKSSTPLKWRIVSSLRKGFEPSKEPLQTVIRIQKERNAIAHPKPYLLEKDIIISNDKIRKVNPDNNYNLPDSNFNVYIGFGKLISEFNFNKSFHSVEKSLISIKQIAELFELEDILEWIKDFEKITNNLK